MEFSKHFNLNAENPLYLYGLASFAVALYVILIIACSGLGNGDVSTTVKFVVSRNLPEKL